MLLLAIKATASRTMNVDESMIIYRAELVDSNFWGEKKNLIGAITRIEFEVIDRDRMVWCSADSLQERYCMWRDKEMKIGQSNNKNNNVILVSNRIVKSMK